MCIFCKIVNKEIPADIVYEDAELLAFRDINPQAPKHILVIPKKHIQSLQVLTEADLNLVKIITIAIQQIAEQEGFAQEGYRVVTNIGKNSGQEVPHLHYHILAGRSMTWPPG
jgi:histidine triad (HIT) family protein